MQNKQQEYFKQREKLECVTQNQVSQKVLDPDIMIEQLISDEKTFRFNPEPQLPYALPKWLKAHNNLVPALYEQVWQAVKLGPANQFCDTRIITQFFTTSGLSLEKLGHLWSLTNVCSPGALTQQELYVMLALIALVQAGYHVKDISILKGINHPILPQLDYYFLNIPVTNPAINRSVSKALVELKPTKTITSNGYSSNQTDTVPPQVRSSIHAKQSPALDLFHEQSDSNVMFAIPQVRLSNHKKNSLNIEKMAELNVDSPEIRSMELKDEKKFDFLTSNDFSSEPKSLDLPAFPVETTNSNEDDEFSEFQSATAITSPPTDEYTDFQSASPIMTYEYDNFETHQKSYNLDLTTTPSQVESEPVDSNSLSNDDNRIYKTTHEADKYDVFRSLIDQNDEKNDAQNVDEGDDEEEEEAEDEDDVEEKVGEKFDEFCSVPPTNSTKKLEPSSIKEKCLKACLQLLQEGSNIFSNIPSEKIIREMLSDERGYRYLNQLKIVYETSQRFQRQTEHVDLNNELQMAWAKLSSYTKYLPSEDLLEDNTYTENDIDASICKLCEMKCDTNYVRYAGNHYHVTCINLFLHFVEDSEISAMLNL